jgi:hypothetical protein
MCPSTFFQEKKGFRLERREYDSHGQVAENYGSTNETVEIHATELRESDVLCRVTYEEGREPRNPQALLPAASADSP